MEAEVHAILTAALTRGGLAQAWVAATHHLRGDEIPLPERSEPADRATPPGHNRLHRARPGPDRPVVDLELTGERDANAQLQSFDTFARTIMARPSCDERTTGPSPPR